MSVVSESIVTRHAFTCQWLLDAIVVFELPNFGTDYNAGSRDQEL